MEPLLLEHGIDGITMSILSLGHLVGLVLGLGTTLFLDGGCVLSITGKSWDGYRSFMSGSLFGFATRYVIVGLAILWITGCGFLIHYAAFSPEKLANPKIYAKLALVSVLSINGYLLHHHVLRRVAEMEDCGHLLTSRVGRLCLLSGAVSAAAWTGAFLLGALPVLNNEVSFFLLVAIWAVLVLVAYLSAKGFIVLFGRHGPERRRSRRTVGLAGRPLDQSSGP